MLPRWDDNVSDITRKDRVETDHWWDSIHHDQLRPVVIRPLVLSTSSYIDGGHRTGVDSTYSLQDSKQQRIKGAKDMELTTSQALGTIFYTLVVFGLGALSGKKIWYWVRSFFPWNRK